MKIASPLDKGDFRGGGKGKPPHPGAARHPSQGGNFQERYPGIDLSRHFSLVSQPSVFRLFGLLICASSFVVLYLCYGHHSHSLLRLAADRCGATQTPLPGNPSRERASLTLSGPDYILRRLKQPTVFGL